MRVGPGGIADALLAEVADADDLRRRCSGVEVARNIVETFCGGGPQALVWQGALDRPSGVSAGLLALFGPAGIGAASRQVSPQAQQGAFPALKELLANVASIANDISAPSEEAPPAQASKSSAGRAGGGRWSQLAGAVQGTADAARQAGINTDFYRSQGHSEFHANLYESADGRTRLGVNAQADGQVRVGLDGAEARGSFEASVGFRTADEGQLSGALGTLEGGYSFAVEARVSGEGYARVGPGGAELTGSLYSGVMAEQGLRGRFESAPIVEIGGYPVTVQSAAESTGRAGTFATAQGEVVATFDPVQAAVDADAGAFAGARACVDAEVGAGPWKTKSTAEAWAGVGVEANLDVGLHDGKLTVGFAAGIAVALGFKLGTEVEIDVGGIGKAIGGLFGGLF